MGPAVRLLLIGLFAPSLGFAETVFLNRDLITVEVGPGTSEGTFNNTFQARQTIDKVIDAPSADAEEFHNQLTHIWFTAARDGGGLELVFDFEVSYDIEKVHFWNYTEETYDVDLLSFRFFDAVGTEIGNVELEPALGRAGGIRAEDIPLAAPLNVRRVVTMLTGTNGQTDFQNIGFTARKSDPARDPPALDVSAQPCVPSGTVICD
ncbi:MAG: PEP-CTERM sorting domain-containing protein [Pseudomonadota bacterium]